MAKLTLSHLSCQYQKESDLLKEKKRISFPLPQKVDTNTFHTPRCDLGCWGTARPLGDRSIWSNSSCSTAAPLTPKWKGMVMQKYEGDDSRAKT